MDIKILEKSDEKIKFIIENTDNGFVNALRRTAFGEIPILSIENVDFYENSSGLYDETVAHRLGLIPLVFDPKAYTLKDECKCEGKGCSRCETTFVIEKVGPCIVRTSDMKCTDDSTPADPDIPIVELLEGQKLKVEAIAQLGFGRDHVKWQASIAGYKNMPVVRLTENADSKIISICPEKVFEKRDGKIKVVNASACSLCMRCTEINEDGVKISADDSSFVFTIESVCGLSANQVLEIALDNMEEKADRFRKELNKHVK
ncbi:MAG: DNA-directed RNA polymerase subunit D [Candidatus Aenigmatarchaeota archaeon]